MTTKTVAFRIGRVRAYQRGRVWYLSYFEQGRRRQPRVGSDKKLARQMAAEINAQLETGIPSALGFEPISLTALRDRWLDHHEHVRRSSLGTIARYRSATKHLLNFVGQECRVRRVSDFRSTHAEQFVRYLRLLRVAPNGHANAGKRTLRDAGVAFILETCSSLFNYAQRNRHLLPYADNPFTTAQVSQVRIEDAKPVVPLTADQETRFLQACDEWQFPVFLTLLMTGMRPGELVHLLLPDDLDLQTGSLHIRNKPALGWQVKTRNQRDIPLVPLLADVLKRLVGDRRTGPVFLQRRCLTGYTAPLCAHALTTLEQELSRRQLLAEASSGRPFCRIERSQIAKTIWRDLGALKEDWIRKEFMTIMKSLGLPQISAPKTLRHTFATILQDANVDPLIRNELMGHAPSGTAGLGGGLGMTAIYTHTRPETKRRQLELAFVDRAAVIDAWQRTEHRCTGDWVP